MDYHPRDKRKKYIRLHGLRIPVNDNEHNIFSSASLALIVVISAIIAFAILLLAIPTCTNAKGENPMRLDQVTRDLPEVVVKSQKREVLHMVAYVREYSMLSTYTDTVLLFREKTVDFMIPEKKLHGFSGWRTPRTLASRSYYHFSDRDGLDSVSGYCRHHFSWSDWIDIPGNLRLPEPLQRDAPTMLSDTTYGRYSPSRLWRKQEDNVSLTIDVLADERNRGWIPSLTSFTRDDTEFTLLQLHYQYSGYGASMTPDNLSGMSYTIQSHGRGGALRQFFRTPDPVYVDTYAELYITDREYLGVGQAKKLQRNPAYGDDIGINPPPEAPPLQPAITNLVARVDDIDIEALRLADKIDPLIHIQKDEPVKTGFTKFMSTLLGVKDGYFFCY